MFPKVVKLSIIYCGKLTALPQAALLSESSGTMVWSAFPALKVLKLKDLESFRRWEAVEGTEREYITFPGLEELSIQFCPVLTALSEAPFPALKVLALKYLESFQCWGAMEGTQGQEIMFPQLENLLIVGCGKLIALPRQSVFPNLENVHIEECPKLKTPSEVPKLKVLEMKGREDEMFLWLARHMTSLTNLKLESLEDTETTCLGAAEQCLSQVVDGKEKRDHDFPLAGMKLVGLKSGVTELCACFVQLQDLKIWYCEWARPLARERVPKLGILEETNDQVVQQADWIRTSSSSRAINIIRKESAPATSRDSGDRVLLKLGRGLRRPCISQENGNLWMQKG